MTKKDAFAALDKTLENDFDEIPAIQVPMVIKEAEVPADRSEDNEQARKNLYDINAKLSSCFDFLIQNFQSQMEAPGLLKASPTGDVVEIAKAMVYVNKQILTLDDAKQKPKEKPTEEHNTQYNTFIGGPNDGLTPAIIDKMIKQAVSNAASSPHSINNNDKEDKA